jgi:hypothetical protein
MGWARRRVTTSRRLERRTPSYVRETGPRPSVRAPHPSGRAPPPRGVPHPPRRHTPPCPPVRPLFRPVHARLPRLAAVLRCKWSGIPSRRRQCPHPLTRRDYKMALPFSSHAHASVALPSSLPWCAHPSASFRHRPTPPAAPLAPNRARTAACCPGRACRSPDIMPPRPTAPGSAAQPRRRRHSPNSGHNRALGELAHSPTSSPPGSAAGTAGIPASRRLPIAKDRIAKVSFFPRALLQTRALSVKAQKLTGACSEV